MIAKKTDQLQRGIVEVMRRCGAFVFDLSGVGHGCPDLLVIRGGKIALVEVKSKKGKLTPAQIEFQVASGYAVQIVRSQLQAFDLVNGMGVK